MINLKRTPTHLFLIDTPRAKLWFNMTMKSERRLPDNGLERACRLIQDAEHTLGVDQRWYTMLHRRMTEEAMKHD